MAPRALLLVTIAVFSLVLAHTLSPTADAPRTRAEERASVPVLDAAARAAGASDDWWQTVREGIARGEYQASPSAGGLQAPNRAQGFRTYFERGGIAIVPRTAEAEPSWRWRFATRRFGRAGALVDLASAEPAANGARVSYARSGLVEWYENGERGLEQGFTVAERPAGTGPLCIRGVWAGDLRAQYRGEEGAVDFLDAAGVRVLRYGGLVVRDATGAEVASRLVLAGAELAMEIEDEGAAYPLIVDPLMTSPAWTAEGNQVDARLGVSVATAGDVNGDGFSDVIVGACYYDNGESNEGRAYVYHGSATGLAAAPAWTVESNQVDAEFGVSAATAGDVNGDGYADVIVGAGLYDNGEPDEGRAFVYLGSAAGLVTTPAWTAEGNQAGAAFGRTVATAGDVNGDGYSDVIVRASDYDNGEPDEGRAFVYHGSATGLPPNPNWTAESNQAFSYFGHSVGTAGDVNGDGYADVIVGALNYDNGQTDEGRAFVYHGSSGGLLASAAWTAESDQADAYYGYAVGTAGDVNGDGYSDVIVGAYAFDNGEGDEGRAYVYQGSSGGLASSAAWTVESNQPGAWLGGKVATAGDVNGDGFADVIVGAALYDNGQADEGRTYVYQGSSTGLAASAAWTAESDQVNAFFGCAVGTAGDVNGDGYSDVIVGAHGFSHGEVAEGGAFVYHGSAAGLATNAGWTAEGNQEDAAFGYSVGTAGDVNGDGYSDVIVGANGYDNGETNEGRAFVFHGSSAGLSAVPAWTAESNQVSADFGNSVATAGDVNGDGYSDVIVGARFYDNADSTNVGEAFAFHGSPAGLSATAAWRVEGNRYWANLGCSVATAGDVNGDGYSDVIVGVPNISRVLVYHGSSAGLAASEAWAVQRYEPQGLFGFSVGTAGDVNGDGFSDVIIGSGNASPGRVCVYYGSALGLLTSPAWNQTGGNDFGFSVGTAGDVNGDGYADVIVGVPGYLDNGLARVYHGSLTGLSLTPDWSEWGGVEGGYFGLSVGTAGDVNGDGYSDVIVGDPRYGPNGYARAYVFHGSASGLGDAAWILEDDQAASLPYLHSVGTAGDVNGDGYADVIVGTKDFTNGQGDEGRASVCYGNGGDGLDRIARQARADDSAPIWLLGRSNSQNEFRLKALGRTPLGRGRVRLQFEVKRAGTPFNGAGLVTGPVVNTGAPGGSGSVVALSGLVTGLMPNWLYHWRLRTLSDSPFFPHSPWFSLPYNSVTEADVRMAALIVDVAAGAGGAPRLQLESAAPNPFRGSTTLAYTTAERGRVRLGVYNAAGREVAVLVDRDEVAGRHVARWDGRNADGRAVPAGVYFVRLRAGEREEATKIVLSR